VFRLRRKHFDPCAVSRSVCKSQYWRTSP